MTKIIHQINTTCNFLSGNIRKTVGDVGKVEYISCSYKKDENPPADGWKEFKKGTRVSGRDGHYWFRTSFKTPAIEENRRINLVMSTGFEGQRDTLNPQGTIYINGKLTQAFDTNHTMVELSPETEYTVHIYFYMGMVDESCEFNLWIAEADKITEKIYYDLFVPLQACKSVYNTNSTEYSNTLKILENACNLLDLRYPLSDEYYKSIELAEKYLKNEYYEKLCGNSTAIVNLIGHTHIDVAWLWTLAQTKEKVQRSFSTVLELMRHYPEYKFTMSQPQLFKFLSETDPELYQQIKQKVREDKWEIDGAMWLEADCNLISGESMIRQIIFGKKFLKQEFGIDSKVLFLPDVFGYNAAMPQILKKSGVEYFVTSKISWNDTNIIPVDTFMWQGIDGSEIFTNFITTQNFVKNGNIANETTYVGQINPSQVAGCWNRYQQKEYNNEVMFTYGWGDGGGGPTADMLEQQRRLAYGLPGIPKTKISTLNEHLHNVKNNFDKACKEIGRVPKWIGELYLEFHRGTYTSRAKTKRNNRKAEFAMQGLESMFSIANSAFNAEYPKKDLDDNWYTVLLNQFHDIIPGSSIKEVYQDSDAQFEDFFAKSEKLSKYVLKQLSENITSNSGVLVVNTLGFDRKGILSVGNNKYIETPIIPAFGWTVIDAKEKSSSITVKGNVAENKFFRLIIDEQGRIISLFDKRFDREIFTKEKAKEIQIYEDFPYRYDNWEISEYYKSKKYILDCDAQIEIIDEGCRKGFQIKQVYHDSTIIQRLYLYDTIERIDVENDIDWHEHRQLVKIAFPFNIHATKTNYDIQFGNVERNNHQNTSWDEAKFEVCGQKWVDMSEYDYGVSLLNDCKYGYSTQENVLKLTVLKSTLYPNPEADQGEHKFTYSIYPHSGDFRSGGTIREAYSLNQKIYSTEIKANNNALLSKDFSFISTDNKNVIIDTVKQSEDGKDIVIRLYDSFDCKSNVTLNFGLPVKKAYLCDMLENELSELNVENNQVNFDLSNFEIATLRIKK